MNFAARLMSAFSDTDEPQLVHTATDGETFGHHHRFGDMALAYCLHLIESEKKAVITVYGEYLEKHPPAHEVKILESTSWSCSHGVERWRGNCGCSTGMHPGWTQAWRAPLRNAMDWLRDSIVPLYEREMSGLIKDPWAARNDYIGVILDRSSESLEAFFQSHAERDLPGEERTQALKLLEMQRHALLMYTSCGWFFDELSGIETTQVIQFADRAVQLAEETSGVRLEEEFVRRISEAPSNLPELGDGGRVYELYVKPARVNLLRVAAHYAISSLFEEYPQTATIHCYAAESLKYARQEMGLLRLATGKARITSVIVGESALVSFAVLHLGDHNMNGGVREFMDDEGFALMEKSIGEPFLKGDVPITIRKMDEIFGSESYSLRDLFKDEQRKVLREVLEPHIDRIENSLFQLYDGFYPIMQVMREQNIPLPAAFSDTGRFIVNAKLKNLLVADGTDLEEMRTVITAMKRFSFPVNRDEIGYVASGKITALMERLRKNPMDLEIVETTSMLLQSLTELDLTLELWRAQNIFFDICLEHRPAFKERTETGETGARNWLEIYDELGSYLMVRCD
jgi:hypothetical protein